MTNINIICKSLTRAREALGLSQTALAQKLGIGQGQISELESGKRDFRVSTLIEYSRAVGLELILVPRVHLPAVSYLIEDMPETREQSSMYENWSEDDI